MDDSISERKHLALIGAGYSHLQVIRLLSRSKSFHTITLINTKPSSVYRGSLPDFIARQDHDFDLIDLQQLCDQQNQASTNTDVRFLLGRVVDIDLDKNLIHLDADEHTGGISDTKSNSEKSIVTYDVLSIDIGSKSKALDEVPGAKSYTIPTRPVYSMLESLKQADEQLQEMANKFEQRQRKENTKEYDPSKSKDDTDPAPIRVAVVGGGANGIELALACRSRWKTILKEQELWISLVSKEAMVLPEVPYARRRLTEILIKNDVYLHMKSAVSQVEKDRLLLTNGTTVPFDHCLWATGAGCHSLPRALQKRGLSVTDDGWIKIHTTLQSTSHPNTFACGDCAAFPNPLPKSGVYGLQEGPVLAENLDRYAREKPLVTYEPNNEDLAFLSLGDGTAMGFAFGLVLRGEWVFEVKQAMNRRHYWSLTGRELTSSLHPRLDQKDRSKLYTYRLNTKVLKDVENVSDRDAAVMLNEINIENYQEAWAILERMSVDPTYRASVMKQYNKLCDSRGKRRHVEDQVKEEDESQSEDAGPRGENQAQSRHINNQRKEQYQDFAPFKLLSWLFKRSCQDDSAVNSTHVDAEKGSIATAYI